MSTTRMTVRWAATAAVLVGLVGLGACSGPGAPTPATPATTAADTPRTMAGRYLDDLAGCLDDAGITVVVDESEGSLDFEGSPAATRRYDAAYARCKTEVPPPPSLSELTTAQWRDLYRQEVRTADCVRALGQDVPEVPPFGRFVRRYQSDDPWYTYLFVEPGDAASWEQLQSTCPQPQL